MPLAQTAPQTDLVELTRPECVRLLAGATVGRIAIGAPGWPPVIRPVLYRFDDASQSVVFHSVEGSKLTSLLHSERVAFEIDGVDSVDQLGWSVVIVGPAEEVTAPSELERLSRVAPAPWVTGRPTHCMRIRATVISGRRLVRAGGER